MTSEPGIIFDEKKFSEKCWSHSVEDLLRLAALDLDLSVDISANSLLGAKWLIVKKWNELSRYLQKSQANAEELYNAIADNPNGVMPWIRCRW